MQLGYIDYIITSCLFIGKFLRNNSGFLINYNFSYQKTIVFY